MTCQRCKTWTAVYSLAVADGWVHTCASCLTWDDLRAIEKESTT